VRVLFGSARRGYQDHVKLGTSEKMDLLAGHRNTLFSAYSSVQSILSICIPVYLYTCVGMYTRDHSKVIDFLGIRTKRSKMKPTIAIPY
jgi:hypothetical protein